MSDDLIYRKDAIDAVLKADKAEIAQRDTYGIWERILSLPAVPWAVLATTPTPTFQPLTDAAAIREAVLREALDAVNAKWRSGAAATPDEMRGLALAEAAVFDLIEKPVVTK